MKDERQALNDMEKVTDLKTWREKKARAVMLPQDCRARLSGSDADRLQQLAADAGISVSEVIRQMIRNSRVVPVDEIRDTLRELNRIGININQLTHACNKHGMTATVSTHLTPALNDVRKACNELLERIR